MFERDTRTSRMQFPLWWMEISATSRRRMIIEPYTIRSSSYPVELRVWVEDEKPQYYYVVESITKKPHGVPSFRMEPVAVEASRRSVPATTGLESVVIEALASGQLMGDCAKNAISQLFWTHFVDDDDGLTWLCKYASKEMGNFYAGRRLDDYVRVRNSTHATHDACHAVEEALKDDSELGQRMCQRVVDDDAFKDAIEALLLTNEDETIQHANVRRLVELNVADKDYVFAGIVAASRSRALRGLRACQRAEHDVEFFEAVAAIARREHTPSVRAKCINAFLHKLKRTP